MDFYGDFMINTNNILYNNSLRDNFSGCYNYFSYYNYFESYLKDFKGLNLRLEYLFLVNIFNNLGLNNDGSSLNSISYDDFLSYKSEMLIVTLDDYLDIPDNFIKSISNDNKDLNDKKMDNSDIFKKSMSIYNTNAEKSSKQLELDKWLGFTSDHNKFKTSVKGVYADLTNNTIFNFVMCCYNYAKKALPKYTSKFSKKTFTQPQLFAVFAYKIYHNLKYRENSESLELSSNLTKALGLKKVPHYTTVQKFFDKLDIKHIRFIDKLLNSLFPAEGCYFSLDGSGMTNSYSDIYYNRRTNKTKRSYIKNHITIDSKYMLIRHSQALNGARHDTQFAIAAINAIKKYKPEYVLTDKAYDAEYIRKEVNEQTTALAMIPLKKNPKTGKNRLNSEAIFRETVYSFRNQVECVFSILKRKFSGINTSRSTRLGKKETIIKNLFYNIYRTIQIINSKTTNQTRI